MTTAPAKGFTLLILACGLLAISSSSVLTKMCAAPALAITLYRVAIASSIYMLLTRRRYGSIHRLYDFPRLRLAIFSGIALSFHFATWISSLRYTSVASSAVLVVTSPIWVAIGNRLIFKEKPRLSTIAGIIITLCGSIIISGADFSGKSSSLFGDLLALLGAMGAAAYWMLGRRLRATLDTFPYVAVVYAACALFTLLIIPFFRVQIWHFDQRTLLLLLAIALLPQMIGHTSLNWALKYFSATAVAIVSLGEPIGASLLAYFILGETISLLQLLGGVIILIGVAIALQAEMAEKKDQSNESL